MDTETSGDTFLPFQADETSVIPGMGLEDRVNADGELEEKAGEIPGLDLDHNFEENKKMSSKKVPYSKPIPRNFQAQWNEMEGEDVEQVEALNAIVNQLIETTPGAIPLNDVTPNAIILYGKMIPVEAGSKLAEAICKGTEAINKLVQSGEIEELRDVIGLNETQEVIEDYLQDEGEIDYSKVPNVELPPPLASSKFAQNPELLKSLNRGGKRKFDQLIGWNDGGINDKTSKLHQPVFSATLIEDSQSNDAESKYRSINEICDDNYKQNLIRDSRNENILEHNIRFSETGGSIRINNMSDQMELKNNFHDTAFRQTKVLFTDTDSEREMEKRQFWDEDNNSLKNINDNLSQSNLDKPDDIETDSFNESNLTHISSHHNTQNINSDTSPSRTVAHINPSQTTSKISNNLQLGANSPTTLMIAHNIVPTPFRHNGPPPPISTSFNPTNYRPSSNNNYSSNLPFRQLGLFSNHNSFNSYPGPPPNFRLLNTNFDRNNFGNTNFRPQNSAQQSTGTTNNYNSNFSSFAGKNGSSRIQVNRQCLNDNNRTIYNNRGRGRDNEQHRSIRGRDHY